MIGMRVNEKSLMSHLTDISGYRLIAGYFE